LELAAAVKAFETGKTRAYPAANGLSIRVLSVPSLSLDQAKVIKEGKKGRRRGRREDMKKKK